MAECGRWTKEYWNVCGIGGNLPEVEKVLRRSSNYCLLHEKCKIQGWKYGQLIIGSRFSAESLSDKPCLPLNNIPNFVSFPHKYPFAADHSQSVGKSSRVQVSISFRVPISSSIAVFHFSPSSESIASFTVLGQSSSTKNPNSFSLNIICSTTRFAHSSFDGLSILVLLDLIVSE